MFETLASSVPQEWQGLYQLLILPLTWLPAAQGYILQAAWPVHTVLEVIPKRVFVLLPALLLIAGLWITMLAIYTLPFRSYRIHFIASLALNWWEMMKAVWLFWVGVFRFLFLAFGWLWGLLVMSFRVVLEFLKEIILFPFRIGTQFSSKYFQPGVPWLAVSLTIFWSILEAGAFYPRRLGVFCLICMMGTLNFAATAGTETRKLSDEEIVQKERNLYPMETYKEIKPGQLEPGAEFPILEEEMEPKTPKIEKLYFAYSGYGELKPLLQGLDTNSAEYRLKYYNRDAGNIQSKLDMELQLKAGLRYGKASLFLEGELSAEATEFDPRRQARLIEAGLGYEFLPSLKLYAGKKTLEWGRGYAWNPAAFVEKEKDPADPESRREGYYMLALDYTTHYTGALKTFTASPVFFPVLEHVNEELGERHALNFAGKLYFLWHDTDINLLFLIGGSQTIRYGLDLAREVASDLEIYCEGAYIHNYQQEFFNPAGQAAENVFGAGSLVMGLRYGSPSAANVILEYYHDSTGYNPEQMRGFYSLIDRGYQQWDASGDNTWLSGRKRWKRPIPRPAPCRITWDCVWAGKNPMPYAIFIRPYRAYIISGIRASPWRRKRRIRKSPILRYGRFAGYWAGR